MVAIVIEVGKHDWKLDVIIIATFISAGMITFIIFVHWRKGPAWWQNVAPVLFITFCVVDYIAFPILCGSLCIISFFELKDNLEFLGTYLLYFAVIFLGRIAEVPQKIYPLLKEAKVILVTKYELRNTPKNELSNMLIDL